MSDNGPQFVSQEYRDFCKSNRIHRVLVAPLPSQALEGEGRERLVHTVCACVFNFPTFWENRNL